MSEINDYGSELFVQPFKQTIVTHELTPSLRKRKSRTEWIIELQREVKVQIANEEKLL